MNKDRFSYDNDNKELAGLIERFEKSLLDGKNFYLDSGQFEELADFYFTQGDMEKAANVAERALAIHPGIPKLISVQIGSYLELGKTEEARALMEEVKNSRSFMIQLMRCEMLRADEKEEEVDALIESLKEIEGDDFDYIDVGYFCLDRMEAEKSMYWFEKALESNPDNEESFYGIAEAHQMLGNYEAPIGMLNNLLDKDPYNVEAWNLLAKSYFALGQFDKTIEACDFALTADETHTPSYELKAYAFSHLKNFEAVNDAFYRACRYGDMKVSQGLMYIGFNLMEMSEWEKAYHCLGKAIQKSSNDPRAILEMRISQSICLCRLERIDEAIQLLLALCQEYPENICPLLYLGKYFLLLDDSESACLLFTEALNISFSDSTWCQIMVISANAGYFDIAINALKGLESVIPSIKELNDEIIAIFTRLRDGNEHSSDFLQLSGYLNDLLANIDLIPNLPEMNSLLLHSHAKEHFSESLLSMRLLFEDLNELIGEE